MQYGESLSSPENMQMMRTSADAPSTVVIWRERKNLVFTSRFPVSPDSILSIQINKTLQQVVLNIQQLDGNKNFVIKIDNDSMPTSVINHKFTQKLHTASIPITFDIIKLKIRKSSSKTTTVSGSCTRRDAATRPICCAVVELRCLFIRQNHSATLVLFIPIEHYITSFLAGLQKFTARTGTAHCAKDSFISNITHELKTPIATVGVAIEALSNFNALKNPQLTKEYLDISKSELNRLTILVDQVLKMSVFEQKEPELRLEIIDVKEAHPANYHFYQAAI